MPIIFSIGKTNGKGNSNQRGKEKSIDFRKSNQLRTLMWNGLVRLKKKMMRVRCPYVRSFLDLAKVFDSVKHALLLEALEKKSTIY